MTDRLGLSDNESFSQELKADLDTNSFEGRRRRRGRRRKLKMTKKAIAARRYARRRRI